MKKVIMVLGIGLGILALTGCGDDNKKHNDPEKKPQKPLHNATLLTKENILAVFQDSAEKTELVEVLLYDKKTKKGKVACYIEDKSCLRDVEEKDYNYGLNNKEVKKTSDGYAIIYDNDTNITRLTDSEGNFTKIRFHSIGINLTIGHIVETTKGNRIGTVDDNIFMTTIKSVNYEARTINDQMCQY